MLFKEFPPKSKAGVMVAVGVSLLLLAAGIAFAILYISDLYIVDKCLDMGGKFDYENDMCVLWQPSIENKYVVLPESARTV